MPHKYIYIYIYRVNKNNRAKISTLEDARISLGYQLFALATIKRDVVVLDDGICNPLFHNNELNRTRCKQNSSVLVRVCISIKEI